MMTFTYHGGTTVHIGNGKRDITVFAEKGTKPGDREIVFFSSPEEEPTEGTISWPGEYDIEGMAIQGIGHDEGGRISWALQIDGVRCAFISSPLHDWTDFELELLGDVDVLVIPCDDPKILQKMVDEVDPRVLIPLDTGGAEKFEESLRICGAQGKEPVDSFELKGSLPSEGREVVVLKAKK